MQYEEAVRIKLSGGKQLQMSTYLFQTAVMTLEMMDMNLMRSKMRHVTILWHSLIQRKAKVRLQRYQGKLRNEKKLKPTEKVIGSSQ